MYNFKNKSIWPLDRTLKIITTPSQIRLRNKNKREFHNNWTITPECNLMSYFGDPAKSYELVSC